ncbi:MAG: anthranilate synthase component I [Anaerolineales bacterium]|jgi:anthranilate synthase component 1
MLLEATTTQTIARELSADLETPISIYMKLRGQGPSFLLESVEGGERIARYSFIGVRPRAQYILRGNVVQIIESGSERTVPLPEDLDPTYFLQEEMSRFHTLPQPGLPRFIGGLVGYLGYEAVRHFEPTLKPQMQIAGAPDGMYLLADTVVAFDHARRSLSLIANVLDGDVQAAERKLDQIQARIQEPLPAPETHENIPSVSRTNLSQERFESMVRAVKEHIAAGDIFQVVLSQRFSRETSASPFDVYRAVRRLNPSPYMFFFDFGDLDGEPFYLVGASPEMFVRLEDGIASLRPIAGTRPRGADPDADAALAEELLADPKERAEHVMLVDLGRNDLGRVCDYGTVNVSEFFSIERYSHVMHIVSHVEGKLKPDLNAFDLVRAAFPAGTVSGAPKVRALEIISELEPDPRGAYAGMVGYFGFDGNMDTCLAIRTMVGSGKTFSVQAGAGIVADSDPATEYQETVNKATAMLRAIEVAETNK